MVKNSPANVRGFSFVVVMKNFYIYLQKVVDIYSIFLYTIKCKEQTTATTKGKVNYNDS